MLTLSSPYDVSSAFYKDRFGSIEDGAFHPGVRARRVLFECLTARAWEHVWELHWSTQTAILWNLAQQKQVDEVKWAAHPNVPSSSFNMTFLNMIHATLTLPFRHDLAMIAFRSTGACSLVWWPAKMFTDSQWEDLHSLFLQPKYLHDVIVVSEQLDKSEQAIKKRNLLFRFKGLTATLFSYGDLAFNITRHILVPTYTVVQSIQDEGLNETDLPHLPTLLSSDPVCVFCGWPDGTLLRVESVTGKPTHDYRVVRPRNYQPPPPVQPTSRHPIHSIHPIVKYAPTKKRQTPRQRNIDEFFG